MTQTISGYPKLNDAQLVILSAAAAREDGALLPFPKSLKTKGAARSRAIGQLLKSGLIEERPVALGAPVWRRDANDSAVGLFITADGLAALDPPAEQRAQVKPPASANVRSGDGRITRPGSNARKANPGKRPGKTKQDAVLKLLRRKGGATLPDICAETGWQAHSARGFLSGTVRKKLGLTLHAEKGADGMRHYRLDQGDRAH